MKRSFLVILSVCSFACDIGESSLTMKALEGPLVADGQTAVNLEVCNASKDPASEVEVKLAASAGAFRNATGENARNITLTLTDDEPCVREAWIPGRKAGTFRFEALVKDVIQAREDVELVEAEVESIELVVAPPVLRTDAASQLKVRVRATTKSGGAPTDGTKVTLEAPEALPSLSAVLSDNQFVFGTSTDVDLTVAEKVETVVLVARYGELSSCKQIAPLGEKPALPCPP